MWGIRIEVKMKGTRQSKKDTNEVGIGDQNSVIYWLRKIHDKMEVIERHQSTNNELLKEQQRNLQEIAGEVSRIKDQMNKEPDHHKEVALNKGEVLTRTPLSEGNRETQKQLQIRKLAYYNLLRSGGIATIFKSFLELEPPFIPHKFREGQIPGETETHRDRMRKLEIMKVTMEIEGLEEECSKHQSKMDESERQVENIIGQYDDPEYRQEMKGQWIKDVKREEEKSEIIWRKKQTFFKELPNKPEVRRNHFVNHHQRNFHGNNNKHPYHSKSEYNTQHQNPWTNRSRNFHPRWPTRRFQ